MELCHGVMRYNTWGRYLLDLEVVVLGTTRIVTLSGTMGRESHDGSGIGCATRVGISSSAATSHDHLANVVFHVG